MTQELFQEKMEDQRLLRVGNGRLIAKKAVINYVTYLNAIRGLVSNEEVLNKIVKALDSLNTQKV